MSLRALALVVPALVTLASCGGAALAPSPEAHAAAAAPEVRDTTAQRTGKPVNMSVAMDSSECGKLRGDETTVALFKKGCDGGDATGCHELFARYLCGVGVPQDSEHAREAATRACDLGLVQACANAGMLLGNQPGGNKALGRKMLEKGCTGGDIAACNNLGTMEMMSGEGQGPVRAAAMFQKLCDTGNVMSCANLAQILAVGLGDVPMDQPRARTLAEGACAKDNFVACNVMGIVLYQATPSDPGGAAKAWTKACDLGAPASCDNLGQLYQHGAGVELDVAHATNLYRKGCNAGVAHSCTALGQLGATANVLGTGVTNTTF